MKMHRIIVGARMALIPTVMLVVFFLLGPAGFAPVVAQGLPVFIRDSAKARFTLGPDTLVTPYPDSAVPMQFSRPTPGATPGKFWVGTNGEVRYSIPIQVPPCAGQVQPQLSLEHSSRAGNGIAGMGLSIGGLSAIEPDAATLSGDETVVSAESPDALLALDGERLV